MFFQPGSQTIRMECVPTWHELRFGSNCHVLTANCAQRSFQLVRSFSLFAMFLSNLNDWKFLNSFFLGRICMLLPGRLLHNPCQNIIKSKRSKVFSKASCKLMRVEFEVSLKVRKGNIIKHTSEGKGSKCLIEKFILAQHSFERVSLRISESLAWSLKWTSPYFWTKPHKERRLLKETFHKITLSLPSKRVVPISLLTLLSSLLLLLLKGLLLLLLFFFCNSLDSPLLLLEGIWLSINVVSVCVMDVKSVMVSGSVVDFSMLFRL